MNNTMRHLTLAAAALAALTVIAPKASAQDRGRGRGFESPRQEFREHGRREWRENAYRGPGRFAYAPPSRYGRHGYRAGFAAPFRIFSGFRFYPAYPGPNYVYIPNYGWALPPFFGAVWIPGHYDFRGFWVEGFWR